MRDAVERFAARVEPYVDGSLQGEGDGWSDKDEAHRSLLEAHIYLSGWVSHRETHGRDPAPGGLDHMEAALADRFRQG